MIEQMIKDIYKHFLIKKLKPFRNTHNNIGLAWDHTNFGLPNISSEEFKFYMKYVL